MRSLIWALVEEAPARDTLREVAEGRGAGVFADICDRSVMDTLLLQLASSSYRDGYRYDIIRRMYFKTPEEVLHA